MYALHFAGNEEFDPSWLHDKDNKVIVFGVEAVAEVVKKLLYSGDEDIAVLRYTGGQPTVPAKFEKRYLKSWRY